jgi:hypothetical protein
MSTMPIPPRPDLSPDDRAAGWAVSAPGRAGVTRRAFEIWRRTLSVAVPLTALLQGIPAFIQRTLTPRSVEPNVLSIWLHTGRFPRYLPPAPQATPNPLVPLSLLATIVLIPLVYVALLRLMMGSSIGEPTDVHRALSCGSKLLGRAIVVGLSASLILMAVGIPLGVVFAILVTAHLWKLGIVILVAGIAPAWAIVSLSLAALLVEGAGGLAAVRRSRRLAWSSPRILVLMLGVMVALSGAGLAPGFIVPHLMSAGGIELLIEGLLELAIGAVVAPLIGAFITSAYLETRAKSEAIDPWVLASALRASDRS